MGRRDPTRMHVRYVLCLSREERKELRLDHHAAGAALEQRAGALTIARVVQTLAFDPVFLAELFGAHALDIAADTSRHEQAEGVVAIRHFASSIARLARASAIV